MGREECQYSCTGSLASKRERVRKRSEKGEGGEESKRKKEGSRRKHRLHSSHAGGPRSASRPVVRVRRIPRTSDMKEGKLTGREEESRLSDLFRNTEPARHCPRPHQHTVSPSQQGCARIRMTRTERQRTCGGGSTARPCRACRARERGQT
jgi:hypothetical protein